jgi:hypothetical protein
MADWQPVASAPCDRPIQLGTVDANGTRCLHFPCRRAGAAWVNAVTGSPVGFMPTHWREWSKAAQAATAVTEARLRVNQLIIGAELCTLYDEFLRQPIPRELSELLDQLAQRELHHLTHRGPEAHGGEAQPADRD